MGFSKEFIWGAASAAAQIEGAWNEDGRTPSIWDITQSGKIKRDETCHVACDHYHRWQEDVAIMKELGLKAYRFSISWSRVIPERGKINEAGLNFYVSLVKALKEAEIEPMVTLYHWDLPVWAFEAGGWDSEEIVTEFAEYVKVITEALSEQVRYWFTFNEPQCFATDFVERKPEADIKKVSRIVMLAHGKAVQIIREYSKQKSEVGLVIMGMCMEPVEGMADEATATSMTFSDMAGAMGVSWWMDPIILGTVPEPLMDTLTEVDIQCICQPLDLFPANVYFSANFSDFPGRNNPLVYPGMPRSYMGMPINPKSLYYFSKYVWERYHLPVLYAENGFSNNDFVMLDGKVHDPQRIDYIKRYILQLKKAVEEGIPVVGYLYWSIMDNFEWYHGYDIRFGLIYVDYQTQKRTIKDSGYYYSDVIKSNGEILGTNQ